MDKNAIKKYAVWARRELISRVAQRALKYGIEKDNITQDMVADINGELLSKDELSQRKALLEQIREKGYEQVMEEVAYTWFNRFIALRFMEVNGYLPTHVRVFTDEENNFKPQILTEAINLEIQGLDMNKVYELKEADDNETLFKYLIITQCNALGSVLPRMFQRIADYTELLFPDNLLREGSAIQQMIELIPEEDWKDAVQIIGWLYQFYNIEPKAEVFGKKSGKISKEEIPAATQLFTPDWIVRYMVENSLGRLWVEGHPNEELKSNWKYYLEEAEQEPDVQAQLEKIKKEYATLKPEEIKCIDPCSGSGHILAYMFDVLMQIYEAYGYTSRDAVQSIVENNIYGLDIDDRAAQLAYFSVMMKARQYDHRFLARKDENGNPNVPQPNVYSIQESNHIDSFTIDEFVNGDDELKTALESILTEFHDAKEYGSILNITPVNFEKLYARFEELSKEASFYGNVIFGLLLPIVKIAEIMSQKYDVVVTNPPYMAVSAGGAKLNSYVKSNYPDSKTDMFAVFIERCSRMTKNNSFYAMITMHSWMFLTSFEKLRQKLQMQNLINLVHLGARAFEEIGGEVVQTCSFVMCNSNFKKFQTTFCRLIDAPSQQQKEMLFLSKGNRYYATNEDFSVIPGNPLAYHSPGILHSFKKYKPISAYAISRAGLSTGNNDKYLRLWHEPDLTHIGFNLNNNDEYLKSDYKYVPCNKGGSYRKWYGNNEYVVDWSTPNEFHRPRTTYMDLYYKPAITWSVIISGDFNCRYYGKGFLFDHAAASLFCNNAKDQYFMLGFMNTNVYRHILRMINPTINSGADVSISIPICRNTNEENVSLLSKANIELSIADWDSFETSWDFKKHPLLTHSVSAIVDADKKDATHWSIENDYNYWVEACKARFQKLKENEEELNRIFIDIYGLQDELTPDVADEDVTVRLADRKRDIKSFISYAVGCMLGRYSLDVEGLAYAGGDWDESKYVTFPADRDNIIPICDDEYFEDDIVGRFVKFVKTVYGSETLDENLKFIAESLGGSGQPKDVIRNYFLNDFYQDHLKTYQKRPIYWLFDSGKKNGFKALVYMHRYAPDTIARMRTDYVHEQQSRYRTAIADLEQRISSASTSEKVKLTKQLQKLQEQATEIQGYEEKIHHLADQYISIDLDDGVKNNYAIFGDVLAKIK